MKTKIMIPFVAMFLVGCGSSSYYVLSDIHPQHSQITSNISIGVEEVEVPKYLFKRELAIATTNNKVTFDSNIQWAEDMDEAITRRVVGTLQQKFRNPNIDKYPWGLDSIPKLILHINITRFITKGNEVYLNATYRITDTKTNKTKSYLYNKSIHLQNTNTDNIVSAMDKLIEYMIDDIARKIQIICWGNNKFF
jgi:cholesterol transport system auxiliary component